jgi:carboxylate-amine ligase
LGKRVEIPTESLLQELLAFIDDVVDDLGSREEVNYVYEIVQRRTGADRQLDVYEKTGSLKAVVDYIVSETEQGITI